jgi:hypothetical protein
MSYTFRLEVKEGLVTVVSDYAYSDNDRTNYLRDPNDPSYLLGFNSEDEAKQYLNEKIKEEHIHPSWVNPDFNQAKLFK